MAIINQGPENANGINAVTHPGNAFASGLVYDQLVPLAKPDNVIPPTAVGSNMGFGAGPVNIPGPNIGGGALNYSPSQMVQETSTPLVTQAPAGNPWNGPLVQNPLFWILAMLMVGWLLLRYVHFRD